MDEVISSGGSAAKGNRTTGYDLATKAGAAKSLDRLLELNLRNIFLAIPTTTPTIITMRERQRRTAQSGPPGRGRSLSRIRRHVDSPLGVAGTTRGAHTTPTSDVAHADDHIWEPLPVDVLWHARTWGGPGKPLAQKPEGNWLSARSDRVDVRVSSTTADANAAEAPSGVDKQQIADSTRALPPLQNQLGHSAPWALQALIRQSGTPQWVFYSLGT